MCTGNSHGKTGLRNQTQNLTALLNQITGILQEFPFGMIGRDCRSQYNEGLILLFFYIIRNVGDVVFKMNGNAFIDQTVGHKSGCLVITGNMEAMLLKPTGQGTHTNPTNAQEIDIFILG